MPIDTSIYGAIRAPSFDPMQQYVTMAQLSSLQRGGEAEELKVQEMKRAIADRATMRDLARGAATYRDTGEVLDGGFDTRKEASGIDMGKYEQSLFSAGFVNEAQAVAKSRAEQQKQMQEMLTKDRETMVALAAEDRKLLPTIRDQASWQNYLDMQKQRAGMFATPQMKEAAMKSLSSLPAKFDPNWIRSSVLSAEQLFKPNVEKVDIGGEIQMVDTNPLTNPAILRTKYTKTMTPGEKATDARGRDSNAETKRHNLETEGISRATAAAAAGTGSREDADNLRKEFEGKEAVKQYRSVVPIVEAARTTPDSRAGDIQIAYAVGKILDPNSVVREGELKLVGQAATLPERIQGEIRTLVMGKGRISPETRAELVKMLDSAVEQRKSAYDAERKSFGDIVARRRYNPADIFIETPKPAAPAQPAGEVQARKKIGNVEFVKINGKWYQP